MVKKIYNSFCLRKVGFFWKFGGLFKNREKIFIIYFLRKRDFFESIADFSKTK